MRDWSRLFGLECPKCGFDMKPHWRLLPDCGEWKSVFMAVCPCGYAEQVRPLDAEKEAEEPPNPVETWVYLNDDNNLRISKDGSEVQTRNPGGSFAALAPVHDLNKTSRSLIAAYRLGRQLALSYG